MKTRQTTAKSYSDFCALEGIHPAFPSSLSTLASWVASLGAKLLQVKTIEAYLTGFRSAHVDMGYTDLGVFHNPMLQRIIAVIRRLRGEAGTKERRPITRDVVLRILTFCNENTWTGANLYAAFCLAFAGFLRIGELTCSADDRVEPEFATWFLARRSVALHDDYLELSLPASKTDNFRRGLTILTASAADEECPVAASRHLFHCFPGPRLAPLFNMGSGSLRQWVMQMLRDTLLELECTGHHSGHSFRRGAATSARDAGLSGDRIMLLGR